MSSSQIHIASVASTTSSSSHAPHATHAPASSHAAHMRRAAQDTHLDKPTTSLADCITAYAVVRLSKPQIAVETGVHYGGLSAFVLRAMDRNGAGALYSIDKPMPDLPPFGEPCGQGCLVPGELHGRWHLINGDSERDLPALLAKLGTIDLFSHDSVQQ